MWPRTAAKGMAESLRSKEIREVIRNLVEMSAKGGFHNLGDATKEELEMVIAALMERADEFKQIALKNFPIDDTDNDTENVDDAKESGDNSGDSANTGASGASGTSTFVDVNTAVEAIKKSMEPQVLQYWPENAKNGIATMLRAKEFREVMESLVKGSVDGGHNSLGGATETQTKAVVDALMINGDALKEEMMEKFPQSVINK